MKAYQSLWVTCCAQLAIVGLVVGFSSYPSHRRSWSFSSALSAPW
jgi:hypothetical protein